MQRRLITIAVCLHITVVAVSAFELQLPAALGGDSQLLQLYKSYTGAGNSYGFFAPGVGSQWRAVINLHQPDRDGWSTLDVPAGSREAKLSIDTINGLLAEDELRDFIAASWAAWAFGQAPSADVAMIDVQMFVIPPVDKFRAGEQPRWVTVGLFPFARDSAR